jgi:hypothetical protein
MNRAMKRLLIWSPRILALLFAAFISLFALDVFSEFSSIWQVLVALVMHLIPTGLVLIALAVAWRWEWLGGTLFVALGTLYLVTAWGRFDWSAYVLISGPLFLVGVLFLVNWFFRARLRTSM